MLSLKLADAWKDFTPPSSPDVSGKKEGGNTVQDSEEFAAPDTDSKTVFEAAPSPTTGSSLYAANPEDFKGMEVQKGSLVSEFPGQAATPLSPAWPRSIFDRPLTPSLIPSSTQPVPVWQPDPQRVDELHALILHGKNDPELDVLLERNPAYRAQAALDDGSVPARALLGQQILREVAGEKYEKEPGFYFLALKEKLPEAATRQEAYAAVYDHYSKAVEKQYEENKARKAAYQKNRVQVDEAVAHVVGGLWSPAELGVRLTPEQTDVYLKEFDTGAVEKAHAAFSLLKDVFSGTPEEGLRRMVSERTAMKITSALSDDDGKGKLTINETAFNLFEGSLRKLMGSVKEQSGDEWKFLHNVELALFNPVSKKNATLGTLLQINSQQNRLVPFAYEHNDKVLEKLEETVREYRTYIKNDRENARVLGLLSTGQDMGNQSNDRASFAAKTVNCLGSVCGQTAPFFVPYAGWGVALAGAYDDKRNRAYYEGLEPGTAEWSAFVDAAASVAVEKISYGALGRLSGAGWVMGKLPFMNKTRKALTDSLWKHVLFEAGAGIVEETFVEPTAEAIIQWAVRSNIAPLAGVNVGGSYDWSNYWNELKGMMEPDQLLATALFVGGLAGGTAGANSLIMQRSLVVNSRSPEMLRMQGIPEDEAKRISLITDNGERVAAVREAVSKLKALPPEEVEKNAGEGVKAFRSLAEVRATVESEAYKFFQQEMRLPLVEEKLDKPGMYNVTVFDVDSGQKKFTQEMAESQLGSLFGNYFNEDKRVQITEAQSAFAANAFLREAEKKKVVQSQDMLQMGKTTGEGQRTEEDKGTEGNGKVEEHPAGEAENDFSPESDSSGSPVPAIPATVTREGEDSSAPLEDDSAVSMDGSAATENLSVLGKFIRTVGGLSQTGFSYLTRVALDEWNRRLDSGMSGEQAYAAPFAPLSPYAPLGSMLGLEKAFKERLKIAARTTGEEGAKQTGLFQMGTAPGTTPADILFLVSKGLVGTREMLEDLFEVGIRNLVKGDRARLEAMGELLRETQAGLQKLGFQGQFISPTGPLDEMKVVEGMSKLALSDTLANAESLPLPQWQKDLLQYHVSYLKDANYLLNLGKAWNLGREKGTITQGMEDILRDLGHRVHTIYDQARIEQQDIQAVMEARAIVFGKGGSSGFAGGPTTSQIRERQQRDEEEEKAHVTTGDRSKERTVPKEALQHPETVALPEAPDSMQGVFVNGASYNPEAGTWIGMVPVDRLHLSPDVPQVKVNSGKKGVVNPLVGDYRADAPPVYVWKRRNGKLEVVSGRHRLDLAQRTGTKAMAAYVYEEDDIHNTQWARLLDYEQNMQDDQADELTAAIYVRETGLTDDELTRRGLTRAGTKSRRGLLIGREAREDLWTRFRSGAIKAQDAEAICLLTRHIQDKGRIDAMQMAAANDLAGGKPLEFVAAKIQLMAHASADGGMVQGLISFGESFEQDMERAAEYVARSIGTINEHINAIKGVRSISRKGNVLSSEGITAGLSEDPAERLKELELLKTMHEKIGLYENLRVRALTWDGKTPPDPIGDHRLDMLAERARAEADAAALEDEENRKAAEKLTSELGFSLTLSRDLETVFPDLWRQAEKELNVKGRVSFSLNGSRVSIHSFSGKNFREALEKGEMLFPVNRVADFSSGLVLAGEIACVLHPESVDGSGKRVSLFDFSGFIIPSSQEESLLPALLERGVPVRVYHVTEEEAAFLGGPRNMEKDDLRKKKELNQRRNNVIRSFLEERDVSFSLSAAERRTAVRARREGTWMKAPDGTPTALTERQWLQVHSEAFREWFGESKIVNDHGEPVVVYHGTARADRVGTVFRGDRATSGPMAFFTDHENIASNYARDKGDTSIVYEAEDYYDYHQQFRLTLPSGQDIPLERYWYYLSPAEQRRISSLAGQIREDWDGDNSIIVDQAINDANGGFPYHLQEARGNAFRALVYHWLESAILLNEEHRFLDVLEKLDLPLSPYYRNPNHQEPKVYACYMRMENPFRTPRITKKMIASLKAASKKAGTPRESWRTDLWDKNNISPEDWIERLEGDYENKTTHAWASIPDWVTAWLRKKGYDGIIDQGGKFHSEDHTVCIPFDSVQIKSATDNNGDFSNFNRDITFSLSNLAAVHSLAAEKLAAAEKLGGLPLPSLAVTRLDKPYTWGDDDNVYLVGSPALADPARGVEIYDRDMWSGHFPELRWNRREEEEREEFYRRAQDAALRYYGSTDVSPLRFLKDALDGDHRGVLESKLRNNDLSLAVFAGERGYAPRPLMQKIPGRLDTGDRIFYSEIRKMRQDKHARFLTVNRQEEFCAAMERAIERYRSQFVQDSQGGKLNVPQTLIRKANLSEMEKELKEAREDYFETISVQALIDADQSGKTVPNWEANYKRFEKYAATHKKAFDAWVKDKMDRWLNPVPRIKENGFPATLENITRYMLGSKGNGAEYKGSFFPTGLLRAKKSRRFHSLDQIRENRDILVTSDEYEASQEEAQGLIQKFQETLFEIVNDFSAYNKAVEALSLIEGEPTPSKVLSALSRFYRGSSFRSRMARNSGNLLGLGAAALHAMKSELRDYYEAVPQRAVQLQEFSHAVMPASLRKNKQIRDILKRNGIRPLYHDGTLEGRTRAMASLINSSASFSLTPGRTSEASSESSWLRFPTADFMASLSEEERAISKKALASGTWLKAPNGEASLLTPRQWVQVRTAAFKSWFGDWLDDPGHASRVVDENGEPRVVYHGTRGDGFTVFDRKKIGANWGFGYYGKGFYFTDNRSAAYHYGHNEITCFLNIRNPYLSLRYNHEGEKRFTSNLKKKKHDGVIGENALRDVYHWHVADGYEYVAFNESQIKSATENVGTFDPDSPDITFSVIGLRAEKWKRYKKKAFTGRDDGMLRAEIDASQAVLKDRSAPYLEPLRRELADLRESLADETKKRIVRFLDLHRKFYQAERTIEAEDHPDLWREYLSFDREREEWSRLLTNVFLHTGLYHTRPNAAAVQAQMISSLRFMLREDEGEIRALASRGADNTVMTLGEWLDYPELFAAYPKLRSMPVIFRYLEEGVLGRFSPAEWTVYIDRSTSDPQKIRSTLLHEIQHAIQQIEGFAKGGTPEAARQFYEFMRREAKEAYEQSDRFVSWLNARDGMISMLEYMLSLARNPHRVLRSSYLYSYDNVLRRLEGEERILDMVRYALEDMSGLLEKFYDEDWNHDARFDLPWPGNYHLNTPSGIQECLEAARATPSRRLAYRRTPKPDLGALYRNFLKYEKLSRLSSHELYSRLAGEIEARNVQFRHDWSADFREDVPFNDSLEYPGESLVSFSLSLTENRPSEDFLSSLSEEERVLAERSWEDGTWLLAPNGEASRLTSRQWLQVRTAAFKRWFGDWEHDPLEASRVVDDNGEPLVVYHGARHAGFTVFDSSEGVSHSEAPPETAFFTNSSSVALSYSGTREEPDLLDPASLEGVYSPPGLYPCFLNIREPWAEEFDGALWDGTGQPLYEFYDNETEDFIFTPNGEEFWKSEEAIREYAEANGYTDYEICNMEGCRTTNTVVQRAMDMCLDGAIIYDVIDMGSRSREEVASNLYIAFRPEQIKSATQNRGTFDPRNPDISFSLAGSLAVQQATGNGDADKPSIRTFQTVQKKFDGWKKGAVNIDQGSGRRNEFTRALEQEGIVSYAYDPFKRHAAHEAPVLRELRRGALQGDTVTCNDVLNLIPDKTARCNVIHQAARSLKPDGTAFFSIYEGDGSGRGRIVKTLSGVGACWQENRKAEDFLREIRPFFEDVKLRDGLIVARSPRRTSPPAPWRQGREMEVLPQVKVAALQKEGYFPQGVLKTANAVLTEPGEDFPPLAEQDTSFSLTAEHASPSSFRKFKDEGKEEEKRVLIYGWGLYFTEDPLKSRAYEKDFRSSDDAKETFYLIDGERSSSSAFSPDEQDILDEIFTNGWDNINSYVERNRDVMDLYGVYRAALDKYRGKTVERVWESLPSSTVSSYRVELNVEEAELLTWEDDVPPVLLDTALAFLKEAHPEFHAELMEYQESPIESGRHVPVRLFCPRLQENMGKKEASKWLLSQGIKGLRYYNGERIPGKKYDYVIFDADDIKITGVRDASSDWKDFVPYHDSSASFSVIGPRSRTWGNYEDRSFVGRDDGKMRVEIDASQARLDMGSIYERDYSELDDMTGLFTATSDIKPLIGTRAARFYSEAREVSQAYRAGKISDDELNDRYRQLLHQWGFQQEATLVGSDEFLNALQEVVTPVIQAVRDVWDFFIKHPLTANAAYVIDRNREMRSAAFNNLIFFMATGDFRFIHAIFPKAGPYKTWMLGEVLDYPELFEAYPVLKGIKVDFRDMQMDEVMGEFNSFENRLSLSIYALENKSADDIRSYFLHEVQHAIQDIEGFAVGGNLFFGAQIFFEKLDKTRSVLNLYLVHLRSGIDHLEEAFRIASDPVKRAEGTLLYKQYLLEGRAMTDERKRSLAAHFLENSLSRAREDLNEDMPEGVPSSLRFPVEQITLPTAQEAMKDKGESLHKAIVQAEALLDPLYFASLKAEERYMERTQQFKEIGGNVGAYLRLAGEIESRNVEHRKDWSAEHRAAEPFNDTLEFPGEALVSFSLGDGHSPASESHSLPGSSPLQDVSQNASQDSQNSQDSLQNESKNEQSIHVSSGCASFTERSLLPRSGEGYPGRGHPDESAGRENPGAGQGLQAGDNQAGSDLSGGGPRRETDSAHTGQFAPAVGLLGVKAYSLSPHLAELASRHDFYAGDIVEVEPSAEGAAHFRRCLEEAKASQVPYGECVYTYDAEEYEHMRLFLLPNGKAGFALKDGDMVSVFSHKQHGCEGRPSYTIIALAVQMGASKCDCYGTILPNLYAKFGFRAVARDRFNAEFSPESMQEPGHMELWYSKQGGKPDVVYMAYEGNRERVMEEFDPEVKSDFKSLPYSDFDACLEIQSRAVEARRDREAADSMSLPDGGASLPLPDSAFYSDSSFSLTSIQKVVSSLTAPSMKATRAAELVKDCDKAAENWRRIMSGKAERPSARVGAELFGMVGSFLSAARYVLPQGYRSNVDMQMQWASVYAAMAESGEIPPKGTLRSGEAIYKKFEESMINNTTTAANAEEVRDILAAIGSQRLDRVMGKILDRVRGQLIRFAKDELYLNTMERVEVIYPKKEIGKKSPRGRMEAQAYRAVARYREMLGATAEVKAEAMETLEAKYNTEEDEEKRQKHEQDILAWKTYGDYAGMSLVQAQQAMEKLLEFIMAGRNSWADKLRKEGGRNKYAARQIQKNLPAVNSGSSRAGAKIEHRTKLRKLLASLPYSFMNYVQLMLALEPVLGQRFSRARIKEISDANAALLNASNDRSAWLFDTICRITGVKSESEAEQWMVEFNTPEKTDIPIAPVMPVRVTLPIEEAKEWFSLSRGERDARRKEIREEDRRMETVTENVPEEEDILLLRQALDEYEEKSPEQQQYQKNLTSLREIPNEDASGILTCSRDCALYAILLHEQPDYADMYDEEGNMIRKGFLRREGLDDAGIDALYDFVAQDGLEYGYALRKRLQETGKTLAKVYEERMGVPFTFKENYFRATFDRNSTKEKDALTEPKTGSIGGGKYGLLIDRVIHSENLDFSKSGTLVFLAAAAEQDNYIYTSHITTAWRALLKNKVLEQKLKQHLGEDMMGKLSSWVDLIDGASLENNRAFLNLSRMQGMLQKAFAVSVLAGNGYVLLKQSSAILHGFFAGWIPSAVLERADGTRELAHRHISFSDYLFHLAASKMGLGDIGLKEVMETPYFQARVRGKGAMLAQIGNQMPGQRYSRMEKLPEKAMDLIEWVDVKANLLAMHALANAYYVKAKALNEDSGSPFTDAQLRESALEQVGISLELGAQPLTKTQKSMNQAAGGILSKLAFVMKSEQLNKLGMMAAEWKTGSARNRVCAAQSWLALGVMSSLLAWLIAWIKGLDDDDDKEKKWRKYGTTALLGDLTTIPLAGEGVNYLVSLITEERVFADSYARTLIDVQGIARTVKKEYEHVADKKEMDWDTHFNNLTALIRAAGVGGAFSRSSSAVVSSYGALSLSAATGANISRTSKDLLSALFRDEDEEERKKKKKGKRKKEKKKSKSSSD